MKTKLFYSFLTFALFLVINSAFGQEHTATLVCDVQALNNDTPASEACYFAEEEDVNPIDFTIEANIGDEILWSGETDADGNTIQIKKIKFERGTEVFNSIEKEGASTIVRTVKFSTKNKPDYKYTISFKINDTGRLYKIDPKVRVGGGG